MLNRSPSVSRFKSELFEAVLLLRQVLLAVAEFRHVPGVMCGCLMYNLLKVTARDVVPQNGH